jgi:hypothetical protein
LDDQKALTSLRVSGCVGGGGMWGECTVFWARLPEPLIQNQNKFIEI